MINYFKNKKGLGPVVATALLLVVVVVGVTGFQTWFTTFQSSINSDVEIQSSNGISSSGIETIIGDKLYFKNAGKENISILKVKIDGFDCNISGNYSYGIEPLNISSCINNITTNTPEIVVFTTNEIFSEKTYIKDSISSDSQSVSTPIINTVTCNGEIPGTTFNFDGETYYVAANMTDIQANINGTIDGSTFTGSYPANNICTSHVTSMNPSGSWNTGIFYNQGNFNQNISTWDVSNVTSMIGMFSSASSFNSDLSLWDVSSVTDMDSMFSYASAFNSDLSSWNVSSVTDMYKMFSYASSFNSDLSSWNVSSVTNMGSMFISASSFNGNISLWDVSSVTDMSAIFFSASSFNSDLSLWDVSSVTNMGSMFSSTSSFNSDLSSWNVSSVTYMYRMFYFATNYSNHDMSPWNVSLVTGHTDFLTSAGSGNTEPIWI